MYIVVWHTTMCAVCDNMEEVNKVVTNLITQGIELFNITIYSAEKKYMPVINIEEFQH